MIYFLNSKKSEYHRQTLFFVLESERLWRIKLPFPFFSFVPPQQRTMAFTNFTRGANRTEAYDRLQCSAHFTEGMYVHLVYISVLNILLSITALLGNALILVALHKESSLHSPSKLLLRSLASTDICIVLIAEPLGIIRWISMVKGDWHLCRYSFPLYLIASFTLASHCVQSNVRDSQ